MSDAPETGLTPPNKARRTPGQVWRIRIIMLCFVTIAIAVVWVTNQLLTERFTEGTRNRAEVRLALHSSAILTELQRTKVVPLLLSRDSILISALTSSDFSQSSQRLISYREETSLGRLLLLDADGRAVAASERQELGTLYRAQPFFINALRSDDTVFSTNELDNGSTVFAYSRRIELGSDRIGVIVVFVDLYKFERTWAGFTDAVLVTNSEGRIILTSEGRWRNLQEDEALQRQSAPSAISQALRATAEWTIPPDAYVQGEAVMRMETRIGFQGWRMTSFTTYSGVRERVNTVLSLEIMGFAILLAGIFYLMSRQANSRLLFFQRESAELRQLNAALQREIAERERAEKNLEVAEQTIQQSSKLAALGEMSAAVSHELNQPLVAMKTYLAGAKLLLQRRRPEEALSSFGRIDDLIERMGSITRQLKSYARKGGDAFEPIDARECVSSALAMMEPQFRRRDIAITRSMPDGPAMVMADRVRLEQVLVNLLRNAHEATLQVPKPEIHLMVSAGDDVIITVRDNGTGIEDLDSLFEPFYTTKAPGDGVGLGLAISSGIVNDLGGRLTARNGRDGGAIFEARLPTLNETIEAAE